MEHRVKHDKGKCVNAFSNSNSNSNQIFLYMLLEFPRASSQSRFHEVKGHPPAISPITSHDDYSLAALGRK
jgi:hypothetical protein